MATDITLRSVKASALTHAEGDQNFESLSQTVDYITVDYSVLVTDQNKILEFDGVDLTATFLPLASADGADTDSFRITIKNINSTDLTIDGSGIETIDGAASITLSENRSVSFSSNRDASEWMVISENTLNTANVFTKTQTWTKGADVASATALSLGDGNLFDVTGTATIESIDSKGVGTTIILQFDGVLQLTHDATSLALPEANNITTAVGDVLVFTEYSAGNWRLASNSSTVLFALRGNNLSDLANVATARTNLGLGALSTKDTVAAADIDDGAVNNLQLGSNAVIASKIDFTTDDRAAWTIAGSGNQVIPEGLFTYVCVANDRIALEIRNNAGNWTTGQLSNSGAAFSDGTNFRLRDLSGLGDTVNYRSMS